MGDAAHFPFIAGSYLGVALLTAGLIAHVIWDALRVKKKLADLEKAGIRRRSSGAAKP